MEAQKTHQLKKGTILDRRYEIEAVLGEGGFGITYAGTNQNTGERVAIKEFFCRDYMDRDGDGTGRTVLTEAGIENRFITERRRFLREARIVRDFRSEPSVVTVLDYFEENDTAYIVMEYVKGETLRRYVRENGRMDPAQCFEELRPLLQALIRLHRAGVIHRDISPENIIRTEDGRLVLIDFGSAKDLSSGTKTTTSTYKDGYAPPEQYRAGCEPSRAMDIYALCATMFYCLSGEVPVSSIQRVLFDEMGPAFAELPVSPEISGMIERGMSLRAEERPKSIEEMLSVIDRVYRPLSPEEKKKKRRRRRQIIAAVICAVLLMAGLGTAHVMRNAAQFRMMTQDTVVAHFTADDAKQTDHLAEILNSRAEVFAGEDNYLLRQDGEDISLEMPVSLLRGQDPEDFLEYYFQQAWRAMILYGVKEDGTADTVIGDNGTQGNSSAYFAADDIEEITISDEVVPIGDTSTAQMPHLKIVLSEEAPEKARKMLSERGTVLGMALDSMYYVTTGCAFSGGDGRTLYLFTGDDVDQEQAMSIYRASVEGRDNQRLVAEATEGGDVNGLVRYNFLEGARLKEPFPDCQFRCEMQVNWEEDDGAVKMGKNQCKSSEIKGESVLISYDTKADSLETGEGIGDVTAFKARMDALGIPYAFGTDVFNENRIVIKTAKDTLLQSEAYLLPMMAKYKISNGYKEEELIGSTWGILDRQEGELELKLQLTDSQWDEVEDLIKQSREHDLQNIWLKIQDVPVAVLDTESFEKSSGGHVIRFSQLCDEGIGKKAESRSHYLDFLAAELGNNLSKNMDMVRIEERDVKDRYKCGGNYGSFKGKCDKALDEMMKQIREHLKDTDCSVNCYFDEVSLGQLRIDVENDCAAADRLEEKMIETIEDILSRYSLYNNDLQTQSLSFRFSNRNDRRASEPLVYMDVYMHPDWDYTGKYKKEMNYLVGVIHARVYTSGNDYLLNEKKTEQLHSRLTKRMRETFGLLYER